MSKYEIMMIIKPNNEEEKIKTIAKDMENCLTDKGASIEEVKELGKKELAYEIAKNKSGFYYLYTFTSKDANAINEFDRLASINEDILRHMIIKLED